MSKNPSIIMTDSHKNMLLRGIKESDLPYKDAMISDALNRIVPVPDDSAAMTDAIMQHPDSSVLLELFVGDTDAVSYIREIKRKLGQRCPEFVVMCEFLSFRMERELYGVGAAAVISRDISAQNLWSMLCERADRKNVSAENAEAICARSAVQSGELEIIVTDIMHKIGVPAHIKGYQYLRCAIVSAVIRPEVINAVTKELYPGVAECFCTTPSRVERAIRHAIEVAWDRGDIDFLSSYFGSTIHNSRGKPTNSEFIAIIADKLRMTLRPAS